MVEEGFGFCGYRKEDLGRLSFEWMFKLLERGRMVFAGTVLFEG